MSIGKKIVTSAITAVIVWAGATSYISSATENALENYLEKIDGVYTNNGMKIRLLSFEKGFLHSYAKMEVDFIDPSMRKSVSQFITLPIISNYKIENGPLLFDKELSFGASRMSNHTNISKMFIDKKSLKEFVKEPIVLNSTMKIGFNKTATYRGKINANEVTNFEGDTFKVSPIIIDSIVDVESLKSNFKLFIKQIEGSLKDNRGGSKLENITFKGELTKIFENGFYLGNFNFFIEKVNLKNKNFPFELKEAQTSIGIDIRENINKNIDFKIDFHLSKGKSDFPVELDVIKKLSLSYGITGATLEGMMAFQNSIKEQQRQQAEVMKYLSTASSVAEQMLAMQQLQTIQLSMEKNMRLNFIKLIDKNTILFITSEIFDNRSKKSMVEAKVSYVGDLPLPSTLEAFNQKVRKELLNLIKVDIDATLQETLTTQLPENIQSQLQMAVATGMISHKNDNYLFNLRYFPRKLTVNGVDKPAMLSLVEMAIEQGK